MDLHSVPNGTTFELAGRKWVKTTSDMMKTGKPILTTADGKLQIIQHGDTFKVNRLADTKTGYMNIGEARSLPQAEKMVGDAAETMGTRPGGAAVAEGTGTAGTVGGKGTEGVDGSVGKAEIHPASRAGKTGEGVPVGKGIETRGNGFREGLIGEGGRRAESASDGFTEGLLGKEGKAGGEGEYIDIRAYKGKEISQLPIEYRADPRLTVEMPYKGKGVRGTNAEGWTRNSRMFFRELVKKNPHLWSKDNLMRIRKGYSPIVDDTFINNFPQYDGYMDDTLVHHHIGGGGQAIAIPRTLHEGFGGIHEYEKSIGVWGNNTMQTDLNMKKGSE